MKKILTLALCCFTTVVIAQIDCKKNISTFKDKFTDEVQVRTAKPAFGSNIFGGKRFDKNGTPIAEEIYFRATGYDPANRDGKIYLILDNGDKLSVDAIIDTDIIRTSRAYSKSFQYVVRLDLTDELWKKFTENQITNFRINGFEEAVSKSAGKIFKERLLCLYNFKLQDTKN